VAEVDGGEMGCCGRGCLRGGRRGEDVNSLSQSSHASKFKVKEGIPRMVRVSGAKSDIVNGTHRLDND